MIHTTPSHTPPKVTNQFNYYDESLMKRIREKLAALGITVPGIIHNTWQIEVHDNEIQRVKKEFKF